MQCYAWLSSVVHLGNVEIADFMPLLIQSLYKYAAAPQNHCIFDFRTHEHMAEHEPVAPDQTLVAALLIGKETDCDYRRGA